MNGENHEIHSDPYAILNLQRDATAKEIREAYLFLSSNFHPDKYVGRDVSHLKGIADSQFNKISHAYKILSNPYRRQVFDQYGEEGLSAFDTGINEENLAMIPVDARSEQLRRAVGGLIWDRQQARAQVAAAAGAECTAEVGLDRLFTLMKHRGINANTRLCCQKCNPGFSSVGWVVLGEDSTKSIRDGVLKPEVRQWVIQHSKVQRLTDDTQLTLAGYVVARKGLGMGALTGTIRRQLTPRDWLSLGADLSGSPRVVFTTGRQLSDRRSAKAAATAGEGGLGLVAGASQRLSPSHTMDVEVRLGPEEGIDVKSYHIRGRNTYKAEANIALNHLGVRFEHMIYMTKCRIIKTFIKFGTWGFEAMTAIGRVVMPLNGTSLGFGVQYSPQGFAIVTRYRAHGLGLRVPVVLSRAAHPAAVGLGALAAAALDWAAGRALGALRRLADMETYELEKVVASIYKTRESAAAQALLMEKLAHSSREQEMEENGLVILEARYGNKVWKCYDPFWYKKKPDSKTLVEEENIDVTVQLQFFVKNSELLLPAGQSKSLLLGFYDAARHAREYGRASAAAGAAAPPGGFLFSGDEDAPPPPRLFVRYRYKGTAYELEAGDYQGVRLPSLDASALGGPTLN